MIMMIIIIMWGFWGVGDFLFVVVLGWVLFFLCGFFVGDFWRSLFFFVCLPYLYPIVVRERNVLFNDALNTFYLRLYGVRHMVKDHSDSEKGNPLPPHRLLLSINSKGSFICTIPQTG